jgi:glycine/D-amino acid oxidase-like deaminating enzyme
MKKAIALQNRCDVPTRLLDMAEALRIVPELDEAPFAGACYNPTDAIVFPWPFLWGLRAGGGPPRGGDPHPHPGERDPPRRAGVRAVDRPRASWPPSAS